MKNEVTPDWAPDDCPLDVVQLIGIEQKLESLGIRGLASNNSKELRNAFRRLSGLMRSNYRDGFRSGVLLGAAVTGLLSLVGGYLVL